MSQDFYDAATYGKMNEVKRMLKDEPSMIHWRDEYGFTALHGAAGEDNAKMIALLVENGADVNAQNDEGIAPLHLCAEAKIARALLACGADLELRSEEGRTPLLELATESERESVIKVLLQAGANVTAQDQDGDTALAIATDREEVATVRLLKKFGAR